MANKLTDEFVQRSMARIRWMSNIADQVTANVELPRESMYLVLNIVFTGLHGHADDADFVEQATVFMKEKLQIAQDAATAVGEPDAILDWLEVLFYTGAPMEEK